MNLTTFQVCSTLFISLTVVGTLGAPQPDGRLNNALAEENDLYGRTKYFYSDMDVVRGNLVIGVLQHRANGQSGFKLLTAAVESSEGLMGRANVVSGDLTIGPIGASVGMGFDTGVKLEDSTGGVELKVGGIGGRIGYKGVEVCVIFCVGLNWGALLG